ncbi:MAG: DMT family transporter, partial [Clostridia bacterium]|nr:DMT family transporter [Clostridia bacterium]
MSNKFKGILLILGAAAGFAFMNLFVKLSGDLPTFQKAFFRNSVACIIASIAIFKNPKMLKTVKGNFGGILARSLFGLLGVILNFYAIGRLNIADASLLNKLSPFFAMVFSCFLLKEKVRKADWAIVALAFFGAVFVIKPSFSYEVLPALAGFFSGL